MGPVRIGGDLVGGDCPDGGVAGTGFVQGERIASVFIGGSVRAGTNDHQDTVNNALTKSGTIRAANDIGPITVRGSLIGTKSPTFGNVTPVIISAEGQAAPTDTTDLAIASVTVGGRVERANILAGYDPDMLNPVNADAQIGPVHVSGDWIASNLVAGVDAGDDGLFGTNDDVLINDATQSPTITAKIGDVHIDGQVVGTPAGDDPNDHYGIVAELVQSLTVHGTAVPLKAGPANDDIALGTTDDVRLLEVAA
jgi:hypothetical protein